jgi:hypothetical protein
VIERPSEEFIDSYEKREGNEMVTIQMDDSILNDNIRKILMWLGKRDAKERLFLYYILLGYMMS